MFTDKHAMHVNNFLLVLVLIAVVGLNLQIAALAAAGGVKTTGAAVAPSPSPAANPQPVAAPTAGPSVDDDPSLGDPNAPVTVIEFSDFQCPFCSRFFDQVEQQLIQEYVSTGKARFVYRDFPLSSIHPLAQKSAEAAECADEQGKFWEMHDLLFTNQGQWSPTDGISAFKAMAQQLGLNTAQFDSCLDSGKYEQEVLADYQAGIAAGVSGTPTTFVNGQKIVGAVPYASIKSAIDSALA